MTTATELSLEVSRHLPHPPERVFDAWLDPEMLQKFMLPAPHMSVTAAENDPRVGGTFKIVMQAPTSKKAGRTPAPILRSTAPPNCASLGCRPTARKTAKSP